MLLTCLLCGSKNNAVLISNKLRDSNDYQIYRCIECSHAQLHPLPTQNEDTQFYDSDLQSSDLHSELDLEDKRNKAQEDMKRRAAFVQKYLTNHSKVLDIGTGYGFFIEEIEKGGHDIEGIELGIKRREVAKKLCKGNIYGINLMEEEVPSFLKNKYNVITLFHVLEHITTPKTFLKNIIKLLKRDGILIVEIPNADDHLLSFCQSYTDFFWQRAHVSYFKPENLQRLLLESGYNNLELEGVQRYSVTNMMNWIQEGKPQIKSPSFKVGEELKWLDDYYRDSLQENMKSDTLIVVAQK